MWWIFIPPILGASPKSSRAVPSEAKFDNLQEQMSRITADLILPLYDILQSMHNSLESVVSSLKAINPSLRQLSPLLSPIPRKFHRLNAAFKPASEAAKAAMNHSRSKNIFCDKLYTRIESTKI